MTKKKFELTSNIVEVDLDEAKNDQIQLNASASTDREIKPAQTSEKQEGRALLTIAVSPDVRKEYKVFCAKKGMRMQDAFIKGFELLKASEYK